MFSMYMLRSCILECFAHLLQGNALSVSVGSTSSIEICPWVIFLLVLFVLIFDKTMLFFFKRSSLATLYFHIIIYRDSTAQVYFNKLIIIKYFTNNICVNYGLLMI